jgi:hypothetical protein
MEGVMRGVCTQLSYDYTPDELVEIQMTVAVSKADLKNGDWRGKELVEIWFNSSRPNAAPSKITKRAKVAADVTDDRSGSW